MRCVFIIGAGRSGTKFVRDTLAASPDVARVPYDIGYVWRHGNEGLHHDEINPDQVSEKSLWWIRKTLPRLVDKDDPKPDAKWLVEKSVPNSLRPLLLYRAFPDARFVHVVRDGRAVTESAMRMWQQPPAKSYLLDKLRYFPWKNLRYGLWFLWNRLRPGRNRQPIWGPRYMGIEEDAGRLPLHIVCARQWVKCVGKASSQLSKIPQDQVTTIRYEDLMCGSDPLEELCEWLGVDSEPVITRYKNTLAQGTNEKWRFSLNVKELEDMDKEFFALPDTIRSFCIDEAVS